ncbi:zinc finger protein with KRAB and SCAN domains 3-like isoform X2 [Rhineura floridana]|uniref:zinc finger protein with KRAB and SCAN domains 3-like isoform X2 n=1 Tax=Rhineura floridana TaxID=261503 RepID=UPI002AC810F4|nr:zinc finger protein with KRAB and SCAN domains 3-like isoform X2 [Rhineura floridana]
MATSRRGRGEVERTRLREAPENFQRGVGLEGAPKDPQASQARHVGRHPDTPMICQEVEPKPDENSYYHWESEFQEFLEGSVWEEQNLAELTPLADTRAFLASFEQVAVACRWPRREWVTRLLPALSEEAEKALAVLDAKDREDFRKVKVAILRREATAREKKHQEFRRFCYQEANGPREVYARLQELCHQWLNVEKSTKEQILEVLILEQFVNVLPKEMQYWVKERGPDSCLHAVALAEDFLRRLQAAEKGGEPEAEEAVPSVSKRQEVQLEMVPIQRGAKRETVVESSSSSRKAYSGNGQASVSKKKPLQWGRYGEVKLRARFPGRASTVLPYRWKQGGSVQEHRRSERLRRTHLPDLAEVPPSPPSPPPPPPSPPPPPREVRPKQASLLQGTILKDQLKICPDCNRGFNGMASFLRHRILHTGEKRYECCFCGKGFCWRSDLVRHECKHTGKKPHECSFCGEGFDRKWQRVKHQLIHTGGKPKL